MFYIRVMETGYKFALMFVVTLVVVVVPDALIGGGLLQYRVDEAFQKIERGFPKVCRIEEISLVTCTKMYRFIQLDICTFSCAKIYLSIQIITV